MGFKAYDRVEYTNPQGLVVRGTVAGCTGHEWPDRGITVIQDLMGYHTTLPAQQLALLPDKAEKYRASIYVSAEVVASDYETALFSLKRSLMKDITGQISSILVIPEYLKGDARNTFQTQNYNVKYGLMGAMNYYHGNPVGLLQELSKVFIEAKTINKRNDPHDLFEEISKVLSDYSEKLAKPRPRKVKKKEVKL